MRRKPRRGLSFGTSPERIAPESLTRTAPHGVTATSRGRRRCGSLHQGDSCAMRDRNAAQSLTPCGTGSRQESMRFLCRDSCGKPVARLRRRRRKIFRSLFDTPAQREAARGGMAVALNWVATSTPWPSGVGIDSLNGTSTRVPAIGTSQTSIAFCAARYLMAARSGT